jgi:hypothetical protein
MIDVKEVLQFADELVFVQTGKHLDDIQDTVIKGVWQGQTYEKIAKQCHRSESHVRDVGYKHLLRQKRCLIIIDDIQDIFSTGQVAGKYKPEYKDYKTFFAKITEIEHQSSLILISQEKCQEMICIDEESYPVKCLELQDLDTTDILKTQKLKDEENWSNLKKLYEGNPTYLQDISSLIRNIFQGRVSEFLSEGLLLTEDMKYQLNELFNRLSTVEQQIILELSKYNKPVSREHLRESLSLSSMELINGLQSLKRRYLVTTIESDKTLFILSPVFREYVIITP